MHTQRLQFEEFAKEVAGACADIAGSYASCEGIAQKIRDEIMETFNLEKGD